MDQSIFRFAPSPNGLLHLGHAYSALTAQTICRAMGGRMLLRIEDIDTERCRAEFEDAMIEDLIWLGFHWEGEVLRQSQNLDRYSGVLDDLLQEGLVYPAFLSRSEILQKVGTWENSNGKVWPTDPDGSALYPGEEQDMDQGMLEILMEESSEYALRLNMQKAIAHIGSSDKLNWEEFRINEGEISISEISATPHEWGDVILARRGIGTSYHLACVMDDALQGVTHVVRGRDLYASTSVHTMLQKIFGYSEISYHHHDLIVDDGGDKLSKRRGDTSIRQLRDAGTSLEDVYRMIGLTL